MASVPRLITTLGGAYSNSYVTLAQADSFAVTFPWYSSTSDRQGWEDYSDSEKTQALLNAAFAMQTLPWAGTRCSPASNADTLPNSWTQYLIVASDNYSGGGVFDYFFDNRIIRGVGQGDNVLQWGKADDTLFQGMTSFRYKTFETGLKFFDKDGTEHPPDRSEIISSSGSSGDETRDVVVYWDEPWDFAYFKGTFNDAFNPGKSGTWYWGVYVNGEQLLEFPGTSKDQAQRMAWPRSGVTCQGVEATCDLIPQSIYETQVLLAYNFLTFPELVPGTPDEPNNTPTGTYIAEQKLGSMSIKYNAWPNGGPVDDCKVCGEASLITDLPWLNDVLGCFLKTTTGNSRVILRVRS